MSNADSLMKYIGVIDRNGGESHERFLRALVGHDRHFSSLSKFLKGRLPDYLEESISDPFVALEYARSVLRGRLPEKVEVVLQSDERCAVRYAFEVVRGFASPRLPDAVHSFLVMKSFEDPHNLEIRKYIQEVERTSEKQVVEGE